MPNVFIDWKCFSCKQCGPWVSCYWYRNINMEIPYIIKHIMSKGNVLIAIHNFRELRTLLIMSKLDLPKLYLYGTCLLTIFLINLKDCQGGCPTIFWKHDVDERCDLDWWRGRGQQQGPRALSWYSEVRQDGVQWFHGLRFTPGFGWGCTYSS